MIPQTAARLAPAHAPLQVEWLGRVPYAQALALQEERLARRRAGACPDTLLLLEHPPVVTLGRSARREHLRVSPAELAARGVALHEAARGGDVTYHGPGQLVGYWIRDLAAHGAPDVVAHVRAIEAALMDALATLGIPARRRPGSSGVFVAKASGPPRKLASIGVGVRGWVSWHGFALNVTLDPAHFDVIVPCGLHDVVMTSVARELGPRVPDPGALELDARAAVSEAFRSVASGAAGEGGR